MFRTTLQKSRPLLLLSVLVVSLSSITGCSRSHAEWRNTTPVQGSNCYAKALPTAGEGGLAWGDTLQTARSYSLYNCKRYASRSGGAPDTCKVVESRCKK